MKLYKDNVQMKIMDIRAVIYDVDGTLVDSFSTIFEYWQMLCKENNRPFPFKDEIEIPINDIESTILPYRYALVKGKPLMSPDLLKYLKEH